MNKKHKQIILVILLSIVLVCIIFFFSLYIYERVTEGWSTNDTLQLIFILCILTVCPYSEKVISDFLINNSNEIRYLNSDIYRAFRELDRNGKLIDVEKTMIVNQDKESFMIINRIIQKKNPSIVIDYANISEYFFDGIYYFGGPKLNKIAKYRVERQSKRISLKKSKKYEELYREYFSGDLLRKPKFPLFESVIPLFLCILAAFISIYQTLTISENASEPLTNYLLLLVLGLMFAGLGCFRNCINNTDEEIKRKKELLLFLKTL